ncbi:hypothetical protein GW17_00036158 [Ensete ventricosum]|nr:hypothetical protein GW17_00036158 [Ensete ventricosum]
MHKLVRVSRKEIRKLKRGRLGLLRNAPQLGLLKSVPRALPSRGLLRDLARRPRRSGGLVSIHILDVRNLVRVWKMFHVTDDKKQIIN